MITGQRNPRMNQKDNGRCVVTLSLTQKEANSLLLAIETAMSKISDGADTVESQTQLSNLDSLWSKIMDAGIEGGFGRQTSHGASVDLDLAQCSEI